MHFKTQLKKQKHSILKSALIASTIFAVSSVSANTQVESQSAKPNALTSQVELTAYQDRPFYFGGLLLSQYEINQIFSSLYAKHTGDKTSSVVDTLKVTGNVFAVVFQGENSEVFSLYTDGSTFFKNESKESAINEKMLKTISKKYELILSQKNKVEQSTAPTQEVQKPKQEQLITSEVKTSEPKQAKQSALHQYIASNLQYTTPVFPMGLDPKKETFISFVSYDCGYCKRMMKDFKTHPERYKDINVAFMPVGEWEGHEAEWKAYFNASELALTTGNLVKNNQFFLKSTELAGASAGTPTNIWRSKKNQNQYILINGQIPSEKMSIVIGDMK